MLVSDLYTPALLVDLGRLHANLDAMQARADAQDVALRPHVKTHKCAEIARKQAERGASGITCATVEEAEAFAAAGFEDIRLATPIVGPTKLERLAALSASGTRISFSVDSAEGVRRAAAAFGAESQVAEVLIEVDTGYGRCGVPWDEPDGIADLAGTVHATAGVRLVGLLSHGGDAYQPGQHGETTDEARRRVMDAERDRVLDIAVGLVQRGLLDTSAELSVGSTPGVSVFT
ncbi:MAG: alanine racemase, partial [Bacteroidota bacterium]